jgi:hypothetical protein
MVLQFPGAAHAIRIPVPTRKMPPRATCPLRPRFKVRFVEETGGVVMDVVKVIPTETSTVEIVTGPDEGPGIPGGANTSVLAGDARRGEGSALG